MGGYWRGSTPKKLINNVNFNPALRLYLIFNDGFECFLANPDNLAEVATHELGHGIGFGHSSVPDAIMRSSAYGNRGPRLGLDDQDAVHCHYPHTFTLVSPRGGDVLQAGTIHRILWNSSFEAGPDTGALDIDLSLDGGTSWSSIVKLTPNDGAFDWLVPATTTSLARIRLIRPNQVSPTPSPYPAACSQVNSAASFAISPPQAGLVPDGGTAPPLLLAPAPGGLITFTWGGSCSAGATDYAIYEGSLSALHSGVWDLSPLTCSAGTDLTQTVAPSPGARYYLVTALTGAAEGSPGWSSSGAPRPASATACLPQEAPGCS
ncbi:MAG: matrixin family metalloprotease [Acidobacteriota bacterium]